MNLRKTAGLAVIFAFLFCMLPLHTTALADEEEAITITQHVQAPDNVIIPDMTFTFNVEPVAPSAAQINEGQSEGVAGGLVVSAPSAAQSADATETATLTTNLSAFTQPGIYLYEVSENKGSTTGIYSGIAYPDTKYIVRVYIDGTDSSNLKLAGYVVYNADDPAETKINHVTFENTYTTYTLTISKKVAGNQGFDNTKFPFQFSISGPQGKEFNLYDNNGDPKVIKAGDPFQIDLSDGESITLTGLSAADAYQIIETTANQDGYKTTIASDNTGSVIDESKGQVTGSNIGADTNITYTNTRNTAVPTGIVSSVLPFVMMIVLAGAFALILRKRVRR